MGLPPTSGFVAKWMLLSASFLTGQWVYGVVIVLGGLLAFGYVFRVLATMMTAPEDEEGGPGVLHVQLPKWISVVVLMLALSTVVLTFVSAVPLRWLEVGAPDTLPVFAQMGGTE